MYGAILGDIIGSPYEFDMGDKSKDFPLFINRSEFTDDSVMTIAVCEALLRCKDNTDETEIQEHVIHGMQKWGKMYPHAGYGSSFIQWLSEENPMPYNSWGNGSAMRTSSIGWLYPTLEQTREVARIVASVTHNHPEGIKGAEATVSVVFLVRNGKSKDEIRDYVIEHFQYDLSRSCDEIRPDYYHVESFNDVGR